MMQTASAYGSWQFSRILHTTLEFIMENLFFYSTKPVVDNKNKQFYTLYYSCVYITITQYTLHSYYTDGCDILRRTK